MNPEAFNFAPVVRGQNSITVKAASTDEHEIVLIGAIGKSWYDDSGITEKEVRDALKSVPAGSRITLKINSEGGSVKEGLGIYNAIRERGDKITARITGYALSIASVFPLAAGKVISPKSAIWMMHKAWSWNQGNAGDMRQAADMLDAHDKTLAAIYAEHTGKPEEEILSAMEKETWVKGADAVAWGLADETDEEKEEAAASNYRPIAASFLDRCKNISPEILNALRVPSAPAKGATTTAPAPSPAQAGDQTGAKAKPGHITAGAENDSAASNAGGQPPTNQPTNQMDKTKIVALLNKHGIEAKADWSDEQFETALAKLAKNNHDAKLEAIEAKLELSENRRITAAVNRYVDAGKITKAEVPIFVSAMKTDEAKTTEILDAKEVQLPGGDTVSGGFDVNEPESPAAKVGIQGARVLPELAALYEANKDPKARYEALKAEFPKLLKAAARRDGGVQNANSFSSTVTTNFLIAGVVVKTYGRFAAFKLFTRDAEQDPFKPLAAGIRKFNSTTTDGSRVGVNVTNFQTLAGSTNGNPDSTIDAVTITPAQYTSAGYITNSQLNSGFRMSDILEQKLVELATKASQVVTAPLTTANIVTNTPYVAAPAAFGFSDLAILQGKIKKVNVKNALLDGEYLAQISNTPGFFQQAGTMNGGNTGAWSAFGWDNIALQTDWTGAGTGVRGWAGGPNTIGIISGMPINPPEGIPGNIVAMGSTQLPDVQVGIATYSWFDPSARTLYFSYDMILGATLLDETQGVLLKDS